MFDFFFFLIAPKITIKIGEIGSLHDLLMSSDLGQRQSVKPRLAGESAKNSHAECTLFYKLLAPLFLGLHPIISHHPEKRDFGPNVEPPNPEDVVGEHHPTIFDTSFREKWDRELGS